MKVLILDTETTGLDPTVHRCIEVACILYSVDHATPIKAYSSLIWSPSNEAEAINGIPAGALEKSPWAKMVWAAVMEYAEQANAIVAHRAEFDRAFVPDELRDVRSWICSKFDLAWPRATRPGEHLVHLALAHGLGVAHAHRAMADCELLARLFTRLAETGIDLQAFLARGLRPKALFQALVSYDDRDKAKEAGFQWDGATKRWLRTMAIEDAATLPFSTQQVLV